MVAMPSGCGRMQVSAAGKVEDELHTNTGLEPVPDIYALGDCCANVETPLPALAQVCARPALSAQGAVRAARAGRSCGVCWGMLLLPQLQQQLQQHAPAAKASDAQLVWQRLVCVTSCSVV